MKNVLLLVALLAVPHSAMSREMALTLDDLPTVRQGETSQQKQREIFFSILSTLDEFTVEATGFVVGKKIVDQHHEELIREFKRRGHTIGNHSYSHFDLNKTQVEDYVADIMRCDEVLKPYLDEVKYFRYPLLHRGNSEQKKQAVYKLLSHHKFVIAPVSIDNNDFLFNVPAREASLAGDREEFERIRHEYLAHMRERIMHFEELAHRKLGREMKHILLLHMSFASSEFLPDLLQQLRGEGWSFISLEEALKDPVYLVPDDYSGPKGLGWMERISAPSVLTTTPTSIPYGGYLGPKLPGEQ
ncbi:MAG: polysaccharide deacetylase family protein [bacterium]|nr:polysaccharide deacetylase family protein [bacterium]